MVHPKIQDLEELRAAVLPEEDSYFDKSGGQFDQLTLNDYLPG